MTTVTLPNATSVATLESDLDAVNNGATNTDFIIPVTADITFGPTDANSTSPTGTTLAVILPTGSTLTFNGPDAFAITSPNELVTDGQVTVDTPVAGEVFVYAGTLVNDAATSGATPAGGVIDGLVYSNQDGIQVFNSGQITGTGAAAIAINGGTVVNAGTVSEAASGGYGIEFQDLGVIQNAGTISATNGAVGAAFFAGGSLQNGGFGEATPAILTGTDDGAAFATAGTATNDGTISSSGGNGLQFLAAGTLTNGSSTDGAAMILSTSATAAGVVAASGSVTNLATIEGGVNGVEFLGDTASDAGAITNTGTIAATDASGGAGTGNVVAGVLMVDGGNVTNGPSGGTVAGTASITGADIGVYVLSGTSTVTNSGTISGTAGIEFIGNSAKTVGTVIDSGAITSTAGANGTAIQFGTGAEKLVLEQGFAITGQVLGGVDAGDTTAIEVAAGTSGTFTGLTGGDGSVTNGFTFQGIQTIDIDSSASWAFSGINSLGTLGVSGAALVSGTLDLTTALDPAGSGGTLTVAAGGTLEVAAATGSGDTIDLAGTGAELKIDVANSFGTTSGSTFTGDVIGQFASGSSIDLANVAFSALAPTSFSGNVLTVGDGTNTGHITFAPGLFSSLGNFVITTDGLGGTLISVAVACYCPGTRIATPDGETEIEQLVIGDLVMTVDGRAEPVRWIGRRSYAGRFLAANPKVHPIRFRKGSLGKGLPRRDLLVSPEHAMFIDGMLIPARCLVNGSLIAVDSTRKAVDYVHIEFANHEVVLAEGVASESFVDDDSRGMFHNASEYAALYPDAPAPAAYYATRVEGGYEVEAVRARLAKIAERVVNRRRVRKLKAA